MSLELKSLKDAVSSMESSVNEANSRAFMGKLSKNQQDTFKAGVIQNFEFTFELCWKMIKRWIAENINPEAAEPLTRKDLFREAARSGLISDPLSWFKYSDARNITSHTYKRSTAESVFQVASAFLPDAKLLLTQLEKRND